MALLTTPSMSQNTVTRLSDYRGGLDLSTDLLDTHTRNYNYDSLTELRT
jgi:hypothetical protein